MSVQDPESVSSEPNGRASGGCANSIPQFLRAFIAPSQSAEAVISKSGRGDGFMDSGANVHILSDSVHNELCSKQLIKFKKQKSVGGDVIQWGGKGASSVSSFYFDAGGAIGKVHLVQDAEVPLFSVVRITAMGYLVLFSSKHVWILEESSWNVVLTGFVDSALSLYYVDIGQLLQLPDRRFQKAPSFGASSVALASRRVSPGQLVELFSDSDSDESDSSISAVAAHDIVDPDICADEFSMELDDVKAASVSPTLRAQRERAKAKGSLIEPSKVRYVRDLHERLFHMPLKAIAEAVRRRVFLHIPEWLTPALLEQIDSKIDCLACAVSKRNRLAQQVGSGIPEAIPGRVLSVDVQGPFTPATTYGCKWTFVFVCVATGFLQVFLAKNKRQLLACTEEAIGYLHRFGHVTRKVRCDAGKVEDSRAFKDLAGRLEFEISPTAPKDQAANPVERYVQTLDHNMLSNMLAQRALPATHWGSAYLAAAAGINARPNKVSSVLGDGDLSPQELITRVKPDIDKFQFPFGQVVTWPRSVDKKSFESVNVFGVAVGHTNENTLVVSPASLVPVVRKSVRPFKANIQAKSELFLQSVATQNIAGRHADGSRLIVSPVSDSEGLQENMFDQFDDNNNIVTDVNDPSLLSGWFRSPGQFDIDSPKPATPNPAVDASPVSATVESVPEPVAITESPVDVTPAVPSEIPVVQPATSDRVLRPRRSPTVYAVRAANKRSEYSAREWYTKLQSQDSDSNPDDPLHSDEQAIVSYFLRRPFQPDRTSEPAFATLAASLPKEPAEAVAFKARKVHTLDNPTQRMIDEDPELQKLWQPAIDKEFSQFVLGKTMVEATEDEYKGHTILPVRPIYKIKYLASGAVDKYKCRLPVDGSVELRNNTFPDPSVNYSPNVRHATFILVFAIAVLLGWRKVSIDVTACFLEVDLHRLVFARFPLSFTKGRKVVFRLLKAVYGLADASRLWFEIITPLLCKVGFIQSVWDPCLFVRSQGEACMVVTVTTDDLFCAVSNDEFGSRMESELVAEMQSRFNITVQDPCKSVIGYCITEHSDGSCTLTQPHMIDVILNDFYPDVDNRERDIQFESIPFPLKWSEADMNASPRIDTTKWLHSLGILIFLIRTRYDILTGISKHSSRTHFCTEKDYACLQQMVRYIYHTREMGITFHPAKPDEFVAALSLVAAADASFLVYERDSKSQIGNCIKLASNITHPSAMFQAHSHKEDDAPSSSAVVSEIKSAFDVTKSLIVARGITEEITGLSMDEPSVIEEDSTGAIRASRDYCKMAASRKMRHEQQKMHAMMHYCKEGIVQMRLVSSADQAADMLTKQLHPLEHWRVMPTIMGHSDAMFSAQKEVFSRSNTTGRRQVKEVISRAYGAVQRAVDFGERVAVDSPREALLSDLESNTALNSFGPLAERVRQSFQSKS